MSVWQGAAGRMGGGERVGESVDAGGALVLPPPGGQALRRCWVHTTANVLDALPKRVQPQAKRMLHEIVEAPTRENAARAIGAFTCEFEPK
jgi:hypothetical protein